MCAPLFVKSSFSSNYGCVEVAPGDSNTIVVRDTKNRTKEAHVFTVVEWDAFVAGVKAGEFDTSTLMLRLGFNGDVP